MALAWVNSVGLTGVARQVCVYRLNDVQTDWGGEHAGEGNALLDVFARDDGEALGGRVEDADDWS